MYLYSHDIYKESMHNKRFIILYRLFVFVCMAVFLSLGLHYDQIIDSQIISIGDPHNVKPEEVPTKFHSL